MDDNILRGYVTAMHDAGAEVAFYSIHLTVCQQQKSKSNGQNYTNVYKSLTINYYNTISLNSVYNDYLPFSQKFTEWIKQPV